MNDLRDELIINCRHEEQRIIDFARQAIARLHKKGAVIGLSGGLASSLCAYLLETALGRKKILALLLCAMSKGCPVDQLAGIASRGNMENVKRCVENARLARSLPLSLD
jgi:NH3-dependent NAD+ synthetase